MVYNSFYFTRTTIVLLLKPVIDDHSKSIYKNSYNVHSSTIQYRLLYHNPDGPRVRNVAVERQADMSEKSQSLVFLITNFVLQSSQSIIESCCRFKVDQREMLYLAICPC